MKKVKRLLRPKRFSLLLKVTACLLLVTVGVLAQQEAGQINGTVRDANDAVIPGASVTVRNTANNAVRTTVTNESGDYVVPSLQPGNYEVTATKQGFGDAKQVIQVTVGSRATVNLTAGVQNVQTETVEVTAGGGVEINTTDQQLSTTVTGKQIANLPILNRNPYALVTLSGNVSEADPSAAGGRGAGVAINGQRAASTSILLDGAENSDTFTSGIAQTTPLDSVAEFQVITSNFSAEYGRASGGIVNVSTRAGNNRFTGTVFGYNRNSALAANSFDNNAKGAERPFFNRNQFGYFVSGPIVKNKLFFSNSTEWTIIRSSGAVFDYVPTQSYINTTNAATQAFFAKYGKLRATAVGAPVVIGGGSTPNFQLVTYNAPIDAGGGIPQDDISTVTRIDWNISEKSQLYGRYAVQRPKFLEGTYTSSPYEGYDISQKIFNHNLLLNFTQLITGNFISNSKFAFRRADTVNQLANDPTFPTLYFFNNSTATFGGDTIALPGYLPRNPGAGLPTSGIEDLYQFNQDMNYLFGKHTLKFGGQFVQIRNSLAFPAYQNAALILGSTIGNAVANLSAGQLRLLQVAIDPQGKFPGQNLNLPVQSPDFSRNNKYNEFALYFNDGWKITPRLNLNLGLRYEYYSPQKSDPNLDANFYFGSGSTIQEQIRNGFAGVAAENGGLWQADKNNFAPRLGFAYDVFGDGKTSIRGGYGIAYERNFGNVTFNVIQNPPFYAVVSAGPADFGGNLPIPVSSFGPLAGSSGTVRLPRSSLRYVRNDIVNAYAHLWSLAGERELFRGTTARVEYSGSAGRDLYTLENINRLGTGVRYLGSDNAAVCPTGFTPDTRLNCQYSNINTRANNGVSNYNGVTASLVSNDLAKSGLSFTARYTYSVTKDNLSSTFSDGVNLINLGLTDPFDPLYDYGYAEGDVRHRFAGSFNYDLPFARNLSNGFAKTLLDGFSINGIITANSGAPFTIYDCTNGLTTCIRLKPTASLVYSTKNPAEAFRVDSGGAQIPLANLFTLIDLANQTPSSFTDGITGATEVGPFPTDVSRRNAFRGPGGWNMDLGLIKNFRLSERYGVQLRAEMINALNMTNFQVVGGSNDLSALDPNNGTRGVQVVKVGSGPGGTQRTIQLSAKFTF